AGVVVLGTPNAFSRFLGHESRDMEKLISRGACVSWTPKNLASSLVMFSLRWMVKHTPYRIFSAYSDTTAGELGTIYQACNFIYLGQKYGARDHYFDPLCPKRGWFTDRFFRKTATVKRYAQALGIPWQRPWQGRDKIYWEKMPEEIAFRLKTAAKKHRNSCLRKKIPKKHKYVYFLGRDKRETQRLRRRFRKLNPSLMKIPYPPKRSLSRRLSPMDEASAESRRSNCPMP
ncbi:MAG: hypothetical protein OXB88_06510, partial [Bacteriovoracales bacterium]|nr:hypothetical protein [Bacteriovoracales bacterium]